jgi:hypothetical protein
MALKRHASGASCARCYVFESKSWRKVAGGLYCNGCGQWMRKRMGSMAADDGAMEMMATEVMR